MSSSEPTKRQHNQIRNRQLQVRVEEAAIDEVGSIGNPISLKQLTRQRLDAGDGAERPVNVGADNAPVVVIGNPTLAKLAGHGRVEEQPRSESPGPEYIGGVCLGLWRWSYQNSIPVRAMAPNMIRVPPSLYPARQPGLIAMK
jgi:hypothetical protein